VSTANNKPGRTGILRILWASKYSMQGISAAWKSEAAFRQELLLTAAMLPLAFWLGQTAVERICLITPLFLVVIVELLNSAIEAIVDRIGPEHHQLSGQAKDMGSAAVFFCTFISGVELDLYSCRSIS
jgi:diacylglycerol kinase (ATP)